MLKFLYRYYLCLRLYLLGYRFIANKGSVVYGRTKNNEYCFWLTNGLRITYLDSFPNRLEADFYYHTKLSEVIQ